MKLKKLTCGQCGGKLKKESKDIFRCESCGTEYLIDRENKLVINNYYNQSYPYKEARELTKKDAIMFSTVIMGLGIFFIILGNIISNTGSTQQSGAKLNNMSSVKKTISKDFPESEAMQDFLSQVYEKKTYLRKN